MANRPLSVPPAFSAAAWKASTSPLFLAAGVLFALLAGPAVRNASLLEDAVYSETLSKGFDSQNSLRTRENAGNLSGF
jgi:hypothetical protein